MAKINFESDLEVSAAGTEIGHNMFQSFLLAGERYVNLGMRRKGTDEERFAELFDGLPVEQKDVLKGHFKRQAILSLSQRTKILGPLVELGIND